MNSVRKAWVALPGPARLCSALRGHAWLCLALLGPARPCLALRGSAQPWPAQPAAQPAAKPAAASVPPIEDLMGAWQNFWAWSNQQPAS